MNCEKFCKKHICMKKRILFGYAKSKDCFMFNDSKEGIKVKNIGNVGRAIRGVLSVTLFSLFFVLPKNKKWFSLFGFIPLATAISGVCPLYSFLHISTRKE
ncbi:YgaP family membrane protein [Caproicibacterium sp. NSD3]